MNETPRKPNRIPIVLSAFVFPGAGQFMQGRWIVGTISLVVFSFFLVVLLVNIFVPLFHNMSAALTMEEELKPISIRSILQPFAFAMIIYLYSLVDVALQYRRQLDAWRMAKHDLL